MSYISPENSKILYGASARIRADGSEVGVVKIRLRDHRNKPVPNRFVALSASRSDVIITQPPATDAEGLALGYVTSTVPGRVTISGRVLPATT